MQEPTTLDDKTTASERAGRNPLLVLLGFMLLGLALTLLVFGSGLLDSGAAAKVSEVTTSGEAVNAFTLPDGVVGVGEIAPQFVLADLEGNPVSLEALRGRPVVLNFWATWCAPCRLEMPELQAAYEAHAGDGLAIIAIDKDESPEAVRQFFYEEMGLTFTPVIDQNSVVGDLYGAFNLPTSFFIDRQGQVTAVHRGMMTADQIEGYLQETLQQ